MASTPRKFPWPEKPSRSPLGDQTDEFHIDDFASDFFYGTWVTSFSGWMLFNPLPEPALGPPPETPAQFQDRVDNLPPLIGGYRWIPPRDPSEPGSYELREGYFLFAALLRFKFDGQGGLSGVMELVRGGSVPFPAASDGQKGYVKRKLTGHYTFGVDPDLPGVPRGTIHQRHWGDGPVENEWNYSFVIKNINELEWLWMTGNYRPLVTHGTLSRMH